ncbi:hypothetical protein BT93_H2234 [Corymbia citriodora subsp. variegata]|nr:hypothetical protein BT93_H2234 [Corymbia citriodora subsp. variegata]
MGKTTVVINNRWVGGWGTTLTVHCKSKDDHLGVHYIRESWSFSFTPNPFGRTLFFCGFSWPSRFERLSDFREFDVRYPWNPTPLMLMSDREI